MVADKLLARNLMTRQVKTVPAQGRLSDALAIMDVGKYDQVPVMDGRKPIALLTEPDARRALYANRQDRPVIELASPLPLLLNPKATLAEALTAVHEHETLLVVSTTGNLMGIITYWDLITLARPYLVLTEVELLLRDVVALNYEKRFGKDWWVHVREDLRRQAEEEHRNDRDQGNDPEHMLGHTSMWPLIEMLRAVRPDIKNEQYQALHEIREYRNRIAHHYTMFPEEVANLLRDARQALDWLTKQRRSMCRNG